jgi:Tfp pilus assembly protein FimT
MFKTRSSQGTFPRMYRLIGLFVACLLASVAVPSLGVGQAFAATALSSHARMASATSLTYNRSNAITYADNHWNWWAYNNSNDPSTGKPVPEGAMQPQFECAEFVSRALTHGGIVPGLSAYNSGQNAYANYRPGNGTTYDLLLVTPTSGYHTLQDYLRDYGLVHNINKDLSQAARGDVVIFMDYVNGQWIGEHTVLIVSVGSNTGNTYIDAHNAAMDNDDTLAYEASGFGSYYIFHIIV